MEPYPAPDDRSDSGQRRRRPFTIWTVLAPVGALVLFILMFQALNDSCVRKGTCTKSKDDGAEKGKLANDIKSHAKAKVQQGQSMGSIAQKYNLTVADLQACNPTIDAQNLQPGQRLNVSAIDCEGQDLAPAGANPDPLADDTSAAPAGSKKPATTPVDPTKNGTAAADPTAKAAAGDAAATTPAPDATNQ